MSLLDYEPEKQETEEQKELRQAEEQKQANAEARRGLSNILGAGPARPSHSGGYEEQDVRLQKPDLFGGDMAVLTARYKERKQRDF